MAAILKIRDDFDGDFSKPIPTCIDTSKEGKHTAEVLEPILQFIEDAKEGKFTDMPPYVVDIEFIRFYPPGQEAIDAAQDMIDELNNCDENNYLFGIDGGECLLTKPYHK